MKYKCLKEKTFKNGEYTIEAVQPEHIEKIRQWRNKQMDVLRQTHAISREEQIEYFKNNVWLEMGKNQPDKILLSIKIKGKLIGYGGLVYISWDNKRAELSFIIDPSLVLNTKSYNNIFSVYLKMINKVAFKNLGLKRLFTETYDFRKEHINILEKNGFIKEGRLRNHIIHEGERIDSIIHGVIDDEI